MDLDTFSLGRFTLLVVAVLTYSLESCAEPSRRPPKPVAPTIEVKGAPKNAAQQPRTERTNPKRPTCPSSDRSPTRLGFMDEALFPTSTARTPRFDDYTPGSYHVQKLDVVQGLRDRSAECSLDLRAVLVVGPVGVLWTYHVATLVAEDGAIRLNALVMPHARITGKGTGIIPFAEASALLDRVAGADVMRPGVPSPDGKGNSGEFQWDVLLARFDREPHEFRHAHVGVVPSEEARDLLDRVNDLLGKASTKVYRHGDAVNGD